MSNKPDDKVATSLDPEFLRQKLHDMTIERNYWRQRSYHLTREMLTGHDEYNDHE